MTRSRLGPGCLRYCKREAVWRRLALALGTRVYSLFFEEEKKNQTTERGTKSELNRVFARIHCRGDFSSTGRVHWLRLGRAVAAEPISGAFIATPNPLSSAAALPEPPQTWRTLTQRQRLAQRSRQPPRATCTRTHTTQDGLARRCVCARAHTLHATRTVFHQTRVCVRVSKRD